MLSIALSGGAEFAELFYENRTITSLSLESQKIENAKAGRVQGVGIRVIAGDNVSYAYTENLTYRSLAKAARIASQIGTNRQGHPETTAVSHPNRSMVESSLRDTPMKRKAEFLARADESARSQAPEIIQVIVNYSDFTQYVEVMNSEGVYVTDDRFFTGIVVEVTGRRGSGQERAFRAIGGQYGIEFYDEKPPEIAGKEAAGAVLRLLDASPAPSGEFPVIIKAGEGVLVHEAVGHALEGDHVNKGSSFYAGRIGQKVASDAVTIYDDGTIAGRINSLRYDDEGTPARKTLLISRGVLQGYMHDRRSAREAGTESTGNGRRQSFRFPPIPRMHSTYIDRGKDTAENLFADIKRGIYITQVGGGRGDLAGGNFVFSINEGYLIENGACTSPIKGTTLVGIGKEVLHSIEGIGDDWALDTLPNYCGKEQLVPVSHGMPTIRLARITVGG